MVSFAMFKPAGTGKGQKTPLKQRSESEMKRGFTLIELLVVIAIM